ncbi:hypothetical protein ACTJKK_08840 [Microbacterium sp. 22179]|uniref:hypothetical protein n=1 Tax=Microbacterium sp. 22179 TaxID=3453886 RepID=UPI003F82B749
MPFDRGAIPVAMFGSGAALLTRFAAWDAAITRPMSTVRRIGFVQLSAGAGATTVAGEIVRLVARRRAAPPLVADLSPEGDLARRLGIVETSPRRDRRVLRTSGDARQLLQMTSGVLGARPSDAAARPVAAWEREVSPVMRFHDLVIADFGPRDPDREIAEIAGLCDAVCVVAPARREGAELARVVVEAIDALPGSPRAVVALVDASRESRRVPAVIAAQTEQPVIVVPHDTALAGGEPARSFRARQALLRLAGTLVGKVGA